MSRIQQRMQENSEPEDLTVDAILYKVSSQCVGKPLRGPTKHDLCDVDDTLTTPAMIHSAWCPGFAGTPALPPTNVYTVSVTAKQDHKYTQA